MPQSYPLDCDFCMFLRSLIKQQMHYDSIVACKSMLRGILLRVISAFTYNELYKM